MQNLDFSQYTELAIRTLKPFDDRMQARHCLMGMIGELGELTDAIKRHLIYGKDLDVVNVKEEVADMLWYTAAFCHTFKLKLLAPSIREYNQADRHLQDLVVSIAALGQVSDHVQAQVLCQQIYNSAASILAMYNIDMADALHSNIEKLAKRYGDKYSDFAALNRDVQAEREVLEANH